MLSEVSQTEKDKYYMISLISGIRKIKEEVAVVGPGQGESLWQLTLSCPPYQAAASGFLIPQEDPEMKVYQMGRRPVGV